MQQRIRLAVALAVALAVVPALAGERTALTPRPDAPRGAIEEGQTCVLCANVAVNVAVLSAGGTQTTGAQTITAPGNESAAPGTRQGSAVNLSVLSPGATQRIGIQMINF